MDAYAWEPEDYFDDPAMEWEDPEALPFGFGRRAPGRSTALTRRFFPPRPTSVPARPAARPPTPVPTTVVDRVRELDLRQRAAANQLASIQQRTTVQQSAEQFGPMATGAVGALALGFKSGDLFAPTVTHGLPLLQLLLASRGNAITSGFRANPWTTLGFPALALFLTAFRESIPGLRPTVVDQPEVNITPDASNTLLVTARKAKGTVLRFTGPAQSVADPDSNSSEFPGVVRLSAGETLKVRAFIGTIGSDVVTILAPASARASR